jgi:2-hydroxychromene-2-carboxylate isomerase
VHVDFWFDFTCPYAYLGSTQIEGVCARAGATLRWRPMLLGGVFRAIGEGDGPMSRLSAAKAAHTAADAHRWAAVHGVPLTFPAGHPVRSVRALRVLLGLPEARWPAAIHALYRLYWCAGGDPARRIDRDEAIDAALAEAGISPASRAAAFAGAESAAIKDDLRARTDEAVALGVFGAPAMVVDTAPPLLLWGQDRLAWLDAVLRGWRLDEQALPPRPIAAAAAHGAAARPRPVIDFYFDVSSPFAYLGSTQIERVAADAGATLRWRPLLLGALFRQLGQADVPLFAMSEPKRRYTTAELPRWARWWGVPFRMASRFPMRTVTAMRMILGAGERAVPLTHRLFRALWVEDLDLADERVLAALAAEVGCDPALVTRTHEPALKQALIDATEGARAAGVFGVPTCVVRTRDDAPGELIWGQDRLELVARAATAP